MRPLGGHLLFWAIVEDEISTSAVVLLECEQSHAGIDRHSTIDQLQHVFGSQVTMWAGERDVDGLNNLLDQ